MIQTLGDVFMLVSIISIGVVAFLFAILIYNLIYVAMDLRKVMRRLNDLSKEVEEMVMAPVQMVSKVVEWVQKWVWNAYMVETPKKSNKKKKRKRKGS